ncbi:MAG: LAGLIDADG family homing endonuclease [Deltaproteobacteria bacterium]|nr:LAGLIDADG family homing endonuclease [Deltaproteobacteria bacterium]
MGAGNQQGRPDEALCHYIAGFVDGEGSFHVAVQRNPTVAIGWQIIPEFHVSQNLCSKNVLELIQSALKCGYIRPNHRTSLKDITWVFVVRSREDLLGKVIPFFERYELRTTKRADFETFASIVKRMQDGEHRTRKGLSSLLQAAFTMNANGSRRKLDLSAILAHLEPSETVRQTSKDEDTVRSARRRAEVA